MPSESLHELYRELLKNIFDAITPLLCLEEAFPGKSSDRLHRSIFETLRIAEEDYEAAKERA
jgi:hypothetical protein